MILQWHTGLLVVKMYWSLSSKWSLSVHSTTYNTIIRAILTPIKITLSQFLNNKPISHSGLKIINKFTNAPFAFYKTTTTFPYFWYNACCYRECMTCSSNPNSRSRIAAVVAAPTGQYNQKSVRQNIITVPVSVTATAHPVVAQNFHSSNRCSVWTAVITKILDQPRYRRKPQIIIRTATMPVIVLATVRISNRSCVLRPSNC